MPKVFVFYQTKSIEVITESRHHSAMKAWMLTVVLGLILFFQWGCATRPEGILIRDANQSLGDIRQAITKTIGEPRSISANQREFFSKYFSRKPNENFDPLKSPERAHVHVVVLGDRRPYNIVVGVRVERKDDEGYYLVGTDEKLSKNLALEIQGILVQSRGGRNVIDDFRAF